MILAAEEVVEAHLVQSGGGRVRGDVATDSDAGTLRAVHHDGRVPADPGAVATLDLFVAREPRFVLGRDRVDVIGGRQSGQCDVLLAGAFEHAQHQVAGAGRA